MDYASTPKPNTNEFHQRLNRDMIGTPIKIVPNKKLTYQTEKKEDPHIAEAKKIYDNRLK